MQRLNINLGARSYPILIGPGLLDDADVLSEVVAASDIMVVTNDVVAPLYLDRLLHALGDRRVATALLPDGERYKTLETMARVLDALVEAKMNRDACVLALGGGVIGDVAGFAAACYQRGVDFVQVPTTLLAQVDSSVGGKTGVNHPGGKNLVGAFHQPIAVISDTDTLRSLPVRELRAGLAEVIKYGLVADAAFLDWLESNLAAPAGAGSAGRGARSAPLLRDQGRDRRRGRARTRRACAAEPRAHLRPRDRGGCGLWRVAARRSGRRGDAAGSRPVAPPRLDRAARKWSGSASCCNARGCARPRPR